MDCPNSESTQFARANCVRTYEILWNLEHCPCNVLRTYGIPREFHSFRSTHAPLGACSLHYVSSLLLASTEFARAKSIRSTALPKAMLYERMKSHEGFHSSYKIPPSTTIRHGRMLYDLQHYRYNAVRTYEILRNFVVRMKFLEEFHRKNFVEEF